MASRILVVDDERVVTEVVERYLKQEDFEVFLAADGHQALESARDWHADLQTIHARKHQVQYYEVWVPISGRLQRLMAVTGNQYSVAQTLQLRLSQLEQFLLIVYYQHALRTSGHDYGLVGSRLLCRVLSTRPGQVELKRCTHAGLRVLIASSA